MQVLNIAIWKCVWRQTLSVNSCLYQHLIDPSLPFTTIFSSLAFEVFAPPLAQNLLFEASSQLETYSSEAHLTKWQVSLVQSSLHAATRNGSHTFVICFRWVVPSAIYAVYTSPTHAPIPNHLPTLIVTPHGTWQVKLLRITCAERMDHH